MYAAAEIKPTNIYKLSEVAIEMDVSLRTLERAVASGKLVARRVGRFTFVSGRSLLNWLEGGNGGKAQETPKPGETAPA